MACRKRKTADVVRLPFRISKTTVELSF